MATPPAAERVSDLTTAEVENVFAQYLADDAMDENRFEARVQRILHGQRGGGGGDDGGGSRKTSQLSKSNMKLGRFDTDGPPELNVNRGRASANEIDQSLHVEQGGIVGKDHHIGEEPASGDGGLEVSCDGGVAVSGDGGEYIDWDAIDALLETA